MLAGRPSLPWCGTAAAGGRGRQGVALPAHTPPLAPEVAPAADGSDDHQNNHHQTDDQRQKVHCRRTNTKLLY